MTGHQVLASPASLPRGFGFANIWPLLFSITVEEKPEAPTNLSGLMCMAISGGAIVPLVMGNCWTGISALIAFIVPAICFAYLLVAFAPGRPGGGEKLTTLHETLYDGDL